MRISKIPNFDFCLREKVDWQPRDWLSYETDQKFELFNLTLIRLNESTQLRVDSISYKYTLNTFMLASKLFHPFLVFKVN